MLTRIVGNIEIPSDLRGLLGRSERRPLVLCGGHPSITDEDIAELSRTSAYVMAMNNAASHVPCDSMVTADRPHCYFSDLFLNPRIMKFSRRSFAQERLSDAETILKDCPNVYYYRLDSDPAPGRLFGDSAAFSWHKNVFTVSVQIAVMLGATEIALLGCAFDNSGDRPYSFDFQLDEEEKRYSQKTYDGVVHFIPSMKAEADHHDVEILSITPGSKANKHLDFVNPIDYFKSLPRSSRGRPVHSSKL